MDYFHEMVDKGFPTCCEEMVAFKLGLPAPSPLSATGLSGVRFSARTFAYPPSLCLCCQAAVSLLCELGSPEDAVALALTADMDLATNVAARSDEDPLRQRHLWIAIAGHVISRPAPEVRPNAAG